MTEAWLGRYLAPQAIGRAGAFRRHAARRARDERECVVVSAAPTVGERAGREALEKLAVAHAAVVSPHVAACEGGVESFEGTPFLELRSRATLDASGALDRLVDARARIGFGELGALLLSLTGALRDAERAPGGPYRLGRLALSSLLVGPDGELELLGLGHSVATTDERGHVCTTDAVFQSSEVAAGALPSARGDRLAIAALRRSLLPHADLPSSLATAMRGEASADGSEALVALIRALESDAQTDGGEELDRLETTLRTIHLQVGIEPDPEGLRRLLSDLALGLPIQSEWDVRQAELTEEVTIVSASGAWIESPVSGRKRVELGPSLRRMVAFLLERHRTEPGRTSSTWELPEAGWPGEKVLPDAGANRVYAALKRLRNMGLRNVIERREDGYRIPVQARITEIGDEV
jgi:hypothetical protein